MVTFKILRFFKEMPQSIPNFSENALNIDSNSRLTKKNVK